ncbi:hypothetical protein D9613_003124 [Agrocybe pediades]|uniref:Chromo domain-containing protein n=1 Tax=Agrocybe pediades TaxID=84607 RepID=A0A8H4QPI8_9AGAR|nr:hypothetical protein D9613_003124 [Agrocybe pediades]
MSDNENDEYEVESIVEARVAAASRAKNPKLVWKYLVRWKGYGPEDDTLEPPESFAESPHIVRDFWERASTGGRDINDMSLFKPGDRFFPVGPPKRRKRKSQGDAEQPTPSASEEQHVEPPPEPVKAPESANTRSSEKRRRSISDVQEKSERQSKRLRSAKSREDLGSSAQTHVQVEPGESISTSKQSAKTPSRASTRKHKQWLKSPSPEVIPDSDEERQKPVSVGVEHDQPVSGNLRKRRRSSLPQQESTSTRGQAHDNFNSNESAVRETTRETRSRNAPAKRASRPDSANTRSKDAGASSNANTKRAKPAESPSPPAKKGSTKRVRGKKSLQTQKASLPIANDIIEVLSDSDDQRQQEPAAVPERRPVDAPLGDTFSGAAQQDVPQVPEQTVSRSADEDQAKQVYEKSFALVKEKLFPSSNSIDLQETFTKDASWTRPTIFGPLGFGSANSITPRAQPSRSQLFLTLDTCVVIPLSISRTELHGHFPHVGKNETPGKFYKTEVGLGLIETVRPSGASGTVDIAEDATDDDKHHFSRFSSRLQTGELFVTSSGPGILMFCSTTRTPISQKLGVPSDSPNEAPKVFATQVQIHDYTGYANAAVNADATRWHTI